MTARISPLAGKTLDPSLLVDVPRLIAAYFNGVPDPAVAAQRVAFGTSGHRGSSFDTSFNEAHILAISQAICQHRRRNGIDGPLFVGIDTHALSRPALATALEVFVANDIVVFVDRHDGYTPTPVISHAILAYNRGRTAGLADGVVITPSHNPPEDGGFKYNPPHGGPAGTAVTAGIEQGANALLPASHAEVLRIPYERARRSSRCHDHDYVGPYVDDLNHVVDMDAIRASGVRIGIDPLGGASVAFWQPIIDRYRISATIVSDTVDPTFGFMTADWDGRIRMDCSSPYAMTRLIGMREGFDVAFANDPDADRHGIVAGPGGLMEPNHFLAASIAYLFAHRPGWSGLAGIGKTVVSSAMIDRVATKLGRRLVEVPVGFKWFTEGLLDGSLGFVGEESAGASFLRHDGTVWATDKDGLIMGLLAAEITASTGHDPSAGYDSIKRELGVSFFARVDGAATPAQKAILKGLSPGDIAMTTLAGEQVRSSFAEAPGNGAPIGGVKVVTDGGWFVARPSGTEDVYKIYAESFRSPGHLRQIQQQSEGAIALLFAGGVADR
ncbi:MAG: alpha-D-glucose phosphate-specific phosphoglucomutase [Caulobacter sp.]|nr:alpha-D-glucose phosphate-specific phosphoglucomutase [Vitreoscilla sp.]